MSPSHLVTLSLFLLFLAIYVRTAAPSVLSGDSAEFQLAAPLLGVPHPTTYPLYILLGKLATLLIPVGDLAWRVTLVSALCAALTVVLFFLLAQRVAGLPGAAVAALALGVAPGLWNAATLAEVYALLAALLVGLGYLLATDHRPTIISEPRTAEPQNRRTDNRDSGSQPPSPIPHPPNYWRLRSAAFVAGLGCTQHGLFVLTGLPLFIGYMLWWLVRPPTDDRRPTTNDEEFRTESQEPRAKNREPRTKNQSSVLSPQSSVLSTTVTNRSLRFTFYALRFKQLAILALCFVAGLAPWLYPLIQYARYGPFDGQDYGLPRHYFWGAPQSWGAVLDLLSGGSLRRGIFRLPQAGAALGTLRLVGERMLFEFGPLGVTLGVLGCGALARRSRAAWFGAAWVFLITLGYLLLLGPAVADAPIFTLPMLLPWAVWIAAAVQLILHTLGRPKIEDRGTKIAMLGQMNCYPRSSSLNPQLIHRWSMVSGRWSVVAVSLLVAATLAWGYTRIQHSSKRRLWLFREFGQATLASLPPGAVVIAHWEQGMTLQYLRLVEGQRPDLWIDVVEPSDESWGARAARRYPGRPVFFVGLPDDVIGLPVDLAREAEYADMFRLHEVR